MGNKSFNPFKFVEKYIFFTLLYFRQRTFSAFCYVICFFHSAYCQQILEAVLVPKSRAIWGGVSAYPAMWSSKSEGCAVLYLENKTLTFRPLCSTDVLGTLHFLKAFFTMPLSSSNIEIEKKSNHFLQEKNGSLYSLYDWDKVNRKK